jgi:hypothetical protein
MSRRATEPSPFGLTRRPTEWLKIENFISLFLEKYILE